MYYRLTLSYILYSVGICYMYILYVRVTIVLDIYGVLWDTLSLSAFRPFVGLAIYTR